MKVGVLTSSRADYSIYLPLLRAMQKDKFFDFDIIAFGTHGSKKHGYTADQIKADGFKIKYLVEDLMEGDTPEAIAKAMGKTTQKFAEIWASEKFDLQVE